MKRYEQQFKIIELASRKKKEHLRRNDDYYCYYCDLWKKVDSNTLRYVCEYCGVVGGYSEEFYQNISYNDSYIYYYKYKYDRIKQFKKKVRQNKLIQTYLSRKLIHMFILIQQPFLKHVPNNRHNFLRYNYNMIKFLELLNETHLVKYFRMPKSKKIIREYDKLWNKICRELEWKFIPSIVNNNIEH